MVSKSDSSVAPSTEAALGFSYSVQLNDKQSIVLQTFLPRDCDPHALNSMLDIMGAAAERQAAKHNIKLLRRSLAMQEKQLRRVTEDLAAIDERNLKAWQGSGKKGAFKESPNQEEHKKSARTTQERFKEEIADLKREINELTDLLES